jgi:hypothetical protein
MMALSIPVVVSRVGWFAELPDDAVAKIDVDAREVELLSVTLERLLNDAELCAAMGENARRYVVEHCAVNDAARYYAEFLNAVMEGRAESKVYGKAVDDERQATDETKNDKRETRSEKRETKSEKQNQKSEIRNLKSEIVTRHPSPVTTDWRDELARVYVALGLAHDDTVLQNVARAVVELGLNE